MSFGYVSPENVDVFVEKAKSLGANVHPIEKDRNRYFWYYFPLLDVNSLPEGNLMLTAWNGSETDDDFWDEMAEEYDYTKASDFNYYDTEQQELIMLLQDGVYYDTSKPFDTLYGADHS